MNWHDFVVVFNYLFLLQEIHDDYFIIRLRLFYVFTVHTSHICKFTFSFIKYFLNYYAIQSEEIQ